MSPTEQGRQSFWVLDVDQIEPESLDAKRHPLIAAFAQLVRTTAGDGVLDFEDLKTRPFMKFWSYIVIHRYEPEHDDFRVIFWGTSIASMFGKDYTGKYLSDIGYGERGKTVHLINKGVIERRETLFKSGNFLWQDREYKEWVQVKMPLKRDERVREVLFCQDFKLKNGEESSAELGNLNPLF